MDKFIWLASFWLLNYFYFCNFWLLIIDRPIFISILFVLFIFLIFRSLFICINSQINVNLFWRRTYWHLLFFVPRIWCILFLSLIYSFFHFIKQKLLRLCFLISCIGFFQQRLISCQFVDCRTIISILMNFNNTFAIFNLFFFLFEIIKRLKHPFFWL